MMALTVHAPWRRGTAAVALTLAAFLLAGMPGGAWTAGGAGAPEAAESRPASSRGAGAGEDGLPHFHRVHDHLYRGGQPDLEAFGELAARGVRTVLNLRSERDDVLDEAAAVRAAGMRFLHVPMEGLGAPPPEALRRVLEVLRDPASHPVFVHCRRGNDRTGLVIGCYRIAVDGWSPASAAAEAAEFGMGWWEREMRKFLRAGCGLPPPGARGSRG
jgi:uncharacterized protein (TIGR01244 family)